MLCLFKDDLSNVSAVAGLVLDPCDVVWTLGPRMFCSWAGASYTG